MRVRSVRLQNFKRFNDLVIRDIPHTAKLVVVVGPNGCGKSSLFDAFFQWHKMKVGLGYSTDELYYRKNASDPFAWNESVTVELHGDQQPQKGSLYVRTAYRNDPDFNTSGFTRLGSPAESYRFSRLIENDQTVSENYQRLIYDTMAGVYDHANNAKTVESLREDLIGQLRTSMRNVFGDLVLNSISDPLGAGAFFFEKGSVNSYHYKNLSGGEKAAFDLLLDLHIKKKFFSDAIYCVDEIDAHLHTRVQGALVREIVDIVPGQSQLWLTTHSLGVLRAAQELAAAVPGSVCVIDFDDVDPDIPRELQPSSLGKVAWTKLLSLVLDDLSDQIAPETVVICEGSTLGTRRKDFDATIYNTILGSRLPDVLFISGGGSNQVGSAAVSVRDVLSPILPSTRVKTLLDRDDRSPAEVQALRSEGCVVLPKRSIESFLFADDVLKALVVREGKPELMADAQRIREEALERSVARGNQMDDLKSASGEIYNGLRSLLALSRCGNNADAFMRDTLAPLIKPEMATYEQLKRAIIDDLP